MKLNSETKILISGGNSYVGSHLANQLFTYSRSHIIICSRAKVNNPIISQRVSYYQSDLLDPSSYLEVVKATQPHIVIHLAAITRLSPGEENPELCIKTNYFGSKMIADICVENGVNILISLSSNLARNPQSVVGFSKYFSEQYLLQKNNKNCRMISIRLPNVLGSPDSVSSIFKSLIENDRPITITDPKMERRFIDNKMASNLISELFNYCHSDIIVVPIENTLITDLAKSMIKESGKDNIEIKIIGKKAGEKLIEEKYHETELERIDNSKLAILKKLAEAADLITNLKILKKKSNHNNFQLLVNKIALSLHLEELNQ